MRWLLAILATVVLVSTGEARGRHKAQVQQAQAAYVQPVYTYYPQTISYSYYVAPVTYAYSPVYEVPVEVPVVVPSAITYEPPPPSEVVCEPPAVSVPPLAPVPAQPGTAIPAVPAVPGSAIPEAAPPSTPEMLPPSSTSRRVSAFRAAPSSDRTSYSIYNNRSSGRLTAADRASVTVWNLTGRTLVLSLNGRPLSIGAGRKLEVDTPRTFSWQVSGQSQEVTSVPEAQNGLTLAIRN
jgi:hypothetical protein